MPAANGERFAQLQALLARLGAQDEVQLIRGQSRELMIAANVLLMASGTASLEAMLLRRPMVLVYRVAPLSWTLMSRLAVTRVVGLPNVFAGHAVVPELLQDRLTAADVALAGEALLFDGDAQISALEPFVQSLAVNFDERVVDALREYLGA
jgi:lipid-A-disaccharide synthase